MMTQMKLWMWNEQTFSDPTEKKQLWDTKQEAHQFQSQIERLLLKNLFRINIHQADSMLNDLKTEQHTIFQRSQLHKMTQ